MRDIFMEYTIPVWHCLTFYLKKSSHAKSKKIMQEKEKSKQKKEKCMEQCNHKYEICL